MPRYDERSGPTRLYVGHISSRTRTRDLEDLFSKYGRVRDVDMKTDFAFVDFYDSRDADDARHYLNGRTFDGSRIAVEFAKKGPRGVGGAREYVGRGPTPGSGRCYNCGHDGHWARDCKAGDWKNKCYRCGQRGHIERDCRSSPRRTRAASRSRSRSPPPARRRSRSPSYSRSPRKERGVSPGPEKRARSDSRSRSPPQSRSRSLTPERDEEKRSPGAAGNGQDSGGSPHGDVSRSPSQSPARDMDVRDNLSPDASPARNGHSPSQSGQSPRSD